MFSKRFALLACYVTLVLVVAFNRPTNAQVFDLGTTGNSGDWLVTAAGTTAVPVSYTHLTLPTICSV